MVAVTGQSGSIPLIMHRLPILIGMFLGSYLGWFLGSTWGWWGSFILSGIGSIGGVFAGWKLGQRIDRR